MNVMDATKAYGLH